MSQERIIRPGENYPTRRKKLSSHQQQPHHYLANVFSCWQLFKLSTILISDRLIDPEVALLCKMATPASFSIVEGPARMASSPRFVKKMA